MDREIDQMTTEHNNAPEVVTTRVDAHMLDHAASRLQAREYAMMSDEKPWNGGQNRGPSPLEYVLMGLGA